MELWMDAVARTGDRDSNGLRYKLSWKQQHKNTNRHPNHHSQSTQQSAQHRLSPTLSGHVHLSPGQP